MCFDDLFKILAIKPLKRELYVEALTHSTYANENRGANSYEKLEFLGDSILQFKSSVFIYQKFQHLNEGQMTQIRSKYCVSNKTLAQIVQNYGINEFLICSNNQEQLRKSPKVCSDIFESLVAAIFLDLGEAALDTFLAKFYFPNLNQISWASESFKDAKTILQELLQANMKKTITYKTEALNDLWFAQAVCDGNNYGQGQGHNKKEAEENAARDALAKFQKIKH